MPREAGDGREASRGRDHGLRIREGGKAMILREHPFGTKAGGTNETRLVLTFVPASYGGKPLPRK